jgi:hypothetical protein
MYEADVTKFVSVLSFVLSIDRRDDMFCRNMVGLGNESFLI